MHHSEAVQHLCHPGQFLQLSGRVGHPGPRSNLVQGETDERKDLFGNLHPSKKANGAVTVGEASGIVHARHRIGALVGQHKRWRRVQSCPRRKVLFPQGSVVTVCVKHEQSAAIDRRMEVCSAVKIADHGDEGEIFRDCSRSAIGRNEHGPWLGGGRDLFDRSGGADHHHP